MLVDKYEFKFKRQSCIDLSCIASHRPNLTRNINARQTLKDNSRDSFRPVLKVILCKMMLPLDAECRTDNNKDGDLLIKIWPACPCWIGLAGWWGIVVLRGIAIKSTSYLSGTRRGIIRVIGMFALIRCD